MTSSISLCYDEDYGTGAIILGAIIQFIIQHQSLCGFGEGYAMNKFNLIKLKLNFI